MLVLTFKKLISHFLLMPKRPLPFPDRERRTATQRHCGPCQNAMREVLHTKVAAAAAMTARETYLTPMNEPGRKHN